MNRPLGQQIRLDGCWLKTLACLKKGVISAVVLSYRIIIRTGNLGYFAVLFYFWLLVFLILLVFFIRLFHKCPLITAGLSPPSGTSGFQEKIAFYVSNSRQPIPLL